MAQPTAPLAQRMQELVSRVRAGGAGEVRPAGTSVRAEAARAEAVAAAADAAEAAAEAADAAAAAGLRAQEESAAARVEVAEVRVALTELARGLDAVRRSVQADPDATDADPGEVADLGLRDLLEARLASLEDALGGVADRLEATARDGASSSEERWERLERRLGDGRAPADEPAAAQALREMGSVVGAALDDVGVAVEESVSTLTQRLREQQEGLGELRAAVLELGDQQAQQAQQVQEQLASVEAVMPRGISPDGAGGAALEEVRTDLGNLTVAVLDLAEASAAQSVGLTGQVDALRATMPAAGDPSPALADLREVLARDLGELRTSVSQSMAQSAQAQAATLSGQAERLQSALAQSLAAKQAQLEQVLADGDGQDEGRAGAELRERITGELQQARAAAAADSLALREDLADALEEVRTRLATTLAREGSPVDQLPAQLTQLSALLADLRDELARRGDADDERQEALAAEREAFAAERDALGAERAAISTELDGLAGERAALSVEVDAIDLLLAEERDARAQRRDAPVPTDAAEALLGAVRAELDDLRDASEVEREQARADVDEMREAVQRSIDSLVDELRQLRLGAAAGGDAALGEEPPAAGPPAGGRRAARPAAATARPAGASQGSRRSRSVPLAGDVGTGDVETSAAETSAAETSAAGATPSQARRSAARRTRGGAAAGEVPGAEDSEAVAGQPAAARRRASRSQPPSS